MFVNIKDKLIALYYPLSKCCKSTTQEFGGNTYSKNTKQLIELLTTYFFFLCIYKMANITKETYEANGIEVIADEFGKLWLNERHVQKQLGLKNLSARTNNYDKEYKKKRFELNKSTKQSHRRFISADLALKVIVDCRIDESCNFKKS